MESLQIFKNNDFGEIRTVTINNEPYFVGKDVASILGYNDTFGALKKHVDDEDKQNCQNDSFESKRGLTVINESGLYSLILSSKLPTAKKFKRWVTSEVLPSIRKTGKYEVNPYKPKATSVGEVASLLKILTRDMEKAGHSREMVSTMIQGVCGEFGIPLPEGYVKKNPFVQISLLVSETD